MINKIFLDMDGVIADFEGRYFSRYGVEPASNRDRKEWSNNWKDFIETKQFETLDWWPEGQELIAYLDTLNIPVEILSSSGGHLNHLSVESQKVKWLKERNINYSVNIVPGRGLKRNYADGNKIMIDDTPDVIVGFNEAGGNGILHRTLAETKSSIEAILNT
jgi:hypothetical protein